VLGIVGKLSARRGARAWFCGIPTYDGKVIEFQSFPMNKKTKQNNFYLHFACGNDTRAHFIKMLKWSNCGTFSYERQTFRHDQLKDFRLQEAIDSKTRTHLSWYHSYKYKYIVANITFELGSLA